VANRYFGVFKNGEIKVRGIELRRRDTPNWIKEVQMEMIKALAEAYTMEGLQEKAAKAFKIFNTALNDLRTGKVPVEKLVITSRISKNLERYKSPTPAVRAARQLFEQTGKRIGPGQKVRFVYIASTQGVCPWELFIPPNPTKLDQEKYVELLARAASSVLYPFGVETEGLKRWAHTSTIELPLNLERRNEHVRTLYSDVRQRRVGRGVWHPADSGGLASQRECLTR
jgi:DNA polymerase-2